MIISRNKNNIVSRYLLILYVFVSVAYMSAFLLSGGRINIGEYPFTPNKALLVIYGITILALLNIPQITFGGLRSMTLPVIYLATLYLSAVWASDKMVTVMSATLDIQYLLIFYLSYLFGSQCNDDQIRNAFKCIIVSAIVVSLVDYLMNYADDLSVRINLIGAYFAAIGVPIIIARSNKYSVVDTLVISIGIGVIVVSLGRAPVGMLFVGLVCAVLILIKLRKPLYPAFCQIGAVLIASLGLIVVLDKYYDYTDILYLFEDRYNLGESNAAEYVLYGGDDLRRMINDYALEMFAQNKWITGMGYGNFQTMVGTENPMLRTETITGKEIYGVNLHNVYYIWILEGGIICFIVVSIIVYKFVARLFKKPPLKQGNCLEYTLIWLIPLVQCGLAGMHHQVQQTFYFWSILGIGFGVAGRFEKELLGRKDVARPCVESAEKY
jgi:hypothetical protein